MGRLFGTDGVRGVANDDLNCELAMNIGRAAATVLSNDNQRRLRILIAKDTRISSDMLEASMIAGLCSVGANVVRLGVIPTPAVALLMPCTYISFVERPSGSTNTGWRSLSANTRRTRASC